MLRSHVSLFVVLLLLGAVCVLSSCSVFSGESGRLRALRDANLAKSVFSAAPWYTDYDHARVVAVNEDKVILAYFTSSYTH
jgi:hypothetical protein